MDRRKFAASLVAASLGSSQALASKAGNSSPSAPQQLHLKPNGWMPNSPLPVLLYRSALPSSADLAADMERIFAANKWPPQWRNGVYTFHHDPGELSAAFVWQHLVRGLLSANLSSWEQGHGEQGH